MAIRVSLSEAYTLDELAAETGRLTGLPVRLRRDLIDENGITAGSAVRFGLFNVQLADALRVTGEALGLAPGRILDARITGGTLEIATRGYYDRLELTDVIYDLSRYARARSSGKHSLSEAQEAMDCLTNAITSMVEPDAWLDNGGTLATIRAVDQSLHINAPPRMHHRIRWLIDTLPPNPIRGTDHTSGGCFGA